MRVWRREKENWRSWGASNGPLKGKKYLNMLKSIRRYSKKLRWRSQKTERPLAKPNWRWQRVYRINPTEGSPTLNTRDSKYFRKSKNRKKASKVRLRRRKTMRSTWRKCTGLKWAWRSSASWSTTKGKSSMSLYAEALTNQTPRTPPILSQRWSNHQIEMVHQSYTTDHGEQLMPKAQAKKERQFYSEIGSLSSPATSRPHPNTKCRIPLAKQGLVQKDSAKDLWNGVLLLQQQL